MAKILTRPITRNYVFSPFDFATKKLLIGCYKAFVKTVVISWEDRIRGSIVYEGVRYTLVITASLTNALREPQNAIFTRVSFQCWSDEQVAVVKMDETAETVATTQDLHDLFGDSNE